ncbi:MAG: hypothetical protein J6U96_00605 [Elusimicrobiaceae bacterium]|nr:hypothetical protein [Elusimicrobiaceae bacterium]
MKKTVLVLFLLGLGVVSAQAQSPGDRMVISAALMNEHVNRAVAQVEKGAKQQIAKAKEQAEVAKECEEATKQLKALSKLSESEALKNVIGYHQNLITKGLMEGKEESVAQHVFLAYEELVNALKVLTEEDSQLGELAGKAANHSYWVKQQRRGLTLSEINVWAHHVFPYLLD